MRTTLALAVIGIAAPLYGQVSDIPVGGCMGTPSVFFPGPATISVLPSSQGSGLTTLVAAITPEFNIFWTLLLETSVANESIVLQVAGGLGPHFEPAVRYSAPDGCLGTSQRFFTLEISNTGKAPWTGLNLELQSTPGVASPPDDGLSFAKIQNNELYVYPVSNCGVAFVFPCSNVFSELTLESASPATHPPTAPAVVKDKLEFSHGLVSPGETVTFEFIVTERDPANQLFYLLLTPVRGNNETAAGADTRR